MPYYSDDSPQVKAAKASGAARRERAEQRKAAQERDEYFRTNPGCVDHPVRCVCDTCALARAINRAF